MSREADIKHCQIVSRQEAERYGFCIEGEVGFLFDLNDNIGIVGYSSLDGIWRFDTGTDDDGDSHSMISGWSGEKDLGELLGMAERVAIICHAADYEAKDKIKNAINMVLRIPQTVMMRVPSL